MDTELAMYDNLDLRLSFGKYKGMPVSVLAEDKGYCDWLMAQPWFRSGHEKIYNVIVNNFTKPEDTPEHNYLQARFLDSIFLKQLMCQILSISDFESFAHLIYGSLNNDGKVEVRKGYNEYELYDSYEIAYRDSGVNCLNIKMDFECNGWDVKITDLINHDDFLFEIKPVIGDDYPTVLREMKQHSMVYNPESRMSYLDTWTGKYLIYRDFNGFGITEDQMKKLFEFSHFNVLTFSEVESLDLSQLDSRISVQFQ